MKHKKKLLGILLAVLLLFCQNQTGFLSELMGGINPVQAKSGNMTVHFLDVGQGLSILVQSEGQTLLYDGGDRSSSSFVVSYLQKQKVDTIDYLISSHYDEDHISGLIGCLNTFSVGNVIGPDYEHNSKLYQNFMADVKNQGLEVLHPEVGSEFDFGSGKFTILAPSYISDDSNNNSVAIRLVNGEDSFIFTGDAEYDSEEEMVNSGLDLDSTVLCLGHHGSASSTSWDLLQASVPEYAVVSCGSGNQYGHPHKDTMDKLASMEIEVLRTDKQGTIVGISKGNGISWNEKPCNDYTPGDETDEGTLPETEANNVWLSATGSKYHSIPNCGKMNPNKARQISEKDAIEQGYEACDKCF